jgi:hypothetical protein
MSMIKAAITLLSGDLSAEAKVAAALQVLRSTPTAKPPIARPEGYVAGYILDAISKCGPMTVRQLNIKNRGISPKELKAAADALVESGEACVLVETHPINGLEIVKYAINGRSGAK